MSVHRFPSRVKRQAQSSTQGPYHPDILREIGRLVMALQPATARQREGVELLSHGLELLELDARPDVYRHELDDFDGYVAGLEELARMSSPFLAAYKRARAADLEAHAFGGNRTHLHALTVRLSLAFYPQQHLEELAAAERQLELSLDAFPQRPEPPPESEEARARALAMLEDLSAKNGGAA